MACSRWWWGTSRCSPIRSDPIALPCLKSRARFHPHRRLSTRLASARFIQLPRIVNAGSGIGFIDGRSSKLPVPRASKRAYENKTSARTGCGDRSGNLRHAGPGRRIVPGFHRLARPGLCATCVCSRLPASGPRRTSSPGGVRSAGGGLPAVPAGLRPRPGASRPRLETWIPSSPRRPAFLWTRSSRTGASLIGTHKEPGPVTGFPLLPVPRPRGGHPGLVEDGGVSHPG